jgi:serine/threonine protein kinase
MSVSRLRRARLLPRRGQEVSVEFNIVPEPLGQVINFSGRKIGTIYVKRDKFAGYTILRLLGSGGMGEVYRARHPRLPRHDATRVLPREVSARVMDNNYAATAVVVMALMNRVRTARKRL